MKRFLILACTVFSLALSSPARAQFEGAPCGDLEGIAEGWRNVFPVGDATTCPDLCNAWVQSCNGVVSAAKQCTLTMFEQLAVVSRAQCATEATQAARSQCLRGFRVQVDAFKAFTKVLAEEAFAQCSGAETVTECLATCDYSEE